MLSSVQSRSGDSTLDHSFVRQLVAHVRAYAELLDRWGLATQHVALLKFIPHDHRLPWEHSQSDGLGMSYLGPVFFLIVLGLSAVNGVSHCCICRLPVAGESSTIFNSLH